MNEPERVIDESKDGVGKTEESLNRPLCWYLLGMVVVSKVL